MIDLPSPWVLRIPASPRTLDRATKTGPAFEVHRPRHTALHGLTLVLTALVVMGAAYCLVLSAGGMAHSLSHPAVEVVR